MTCVDDIGLSFWGPKAARRARHMWQGVALVEQVVAPTGALWKAARRGKEGRVPVVKGFVDGYVWGLVSRCPSSCVYHH